jgi:glycosyltransferase involved in cell wall biosynthesis
VRIGFVVPRYGTAVVGGAELAARLLAEHLVMLGGHECEVFTTTALDASTWAHECAEGTTLEAGVTVHRFRGHGRGDDFAPLDAAVLAGRVNDDATARRWLEQLGPVCDDAVAAAADSGCDVVTLHPYMYHPILTAAARLGRRALLHPATHDEPAIHLPIYAPLFRGVGGLAFWTEDEQRLTARLFPAAASMPQQVIGIGVDDPSAPAGDSGIDRPYVLCLGKVAASKGCVALARAFTAYKEHRPGPLQLVFAGPVLDAVGPFADVQVLGAVDDARRDALLAGCVALVSPSAYESLSLVVLEAWAAGRPVIVNGACAVTRNHCLRSDGGLWFDSAAQFGLALERIVADTALGDALGAAGREYVRREYRWATVLQRYTRLLEYVAAAAAR